MNGGIERRFVGVIYCQRTPVGWEVPWILPVHLSKSVWVEVVLREVRIEVLCFHLK
jgi:hypothetical protein